VGIVSRQIERALTTKARPRSTQNSKSGVSALVRESRRQRPPNAGMYRAWSVHSPVVRPLIDHLKNECRRAQWELVPFSKNMPAPDKGLIQEITDRFNQPNPEDSSFGEFFERIIEDQLTLDAGVVEKERRYRGDLVGLHPTMGEFVKVDRFWNGDPKSPRYFWEPDPSVSESFLNANMIYGRIHPRTNSGVGISYLETLKNTIENLLNASAYNGRMVRQAVPDGIMDLGETARPDQVDAFKAYFAAELEGKEILGFWGGTRGAKFIPLRGAGNSNRDMQYIDWLQFEIRIACAVFHVSTQNLNFGFDINKANGEVQQENTETGGALPLLQKWQDYFTAEVCWDPMYGGMANNIAFRFRDVTNRQSLQKAQTHKITLAGMPMQSINEARSEVGLPPIAPADYSGDVLDAKNPYNQLQANTSQGLVTLGDTMTARELAERKTEPKQIGAGEKKPVPADDE
jgi:phage portal protein BeeE